jgi:predicted transcriptional regulator
MAPRESELGSAELEVLKTLWDMGPATVRQVMNRLHDRGRTVAYTTVLTFLTRLEQKGFVKSDKSALAYVYKPTVSRDRVSRSRLNTLVQELYDGAVGPLILQLMRAERVTPDEIAQLQELIDELDARPARRRRGS